MVRVLADTGMRRGECCGLQCKDIDFKQNTITISGNLCYTKTAGVYMDTPKNGKPDGGCGSAGDRLATAAPAGAGPPHYEQMGIYPGRKFGGYALTKPDTVFVPICKAARDQQPIPP